MALHCDKHSSLPFIIDIENSSLLAQTKGVKHTLQHDEIQDIGLLRCDS